MNQKSIVINWAGREVYPSYRLEDMTDDPAFGVTLVSFTSEDVLELADGTLTATVVIAKGVYGPRKLRLTAIDDEGESSPGNDFEAKLSRDLPTSPANVSVTY